jgi:HAD superfamily hydrolase (TIGR01509 family)
VPSGAVVFDCDGTLLATLGAWERAYATLFRSCGRTFDARHLRRLVGLPLGPLGRVLAELLDRPGDHAELSSRMVQLLTVERAEPVRPMPGAVDLVHALRGRRPVAVASNTPRPIVVEYLRDIGLDGVFDAVLGCDDVTAAKPAPDIYLSACRRLGVDPAAAVAIEDCPVGIASARAAGLFVIGVAPSASEQQPVDCAVNGLCDMALWRLLGVAGEDSA